MSALSLVPLLVAALLLALVPATAHSYGEVRIVASSDSPGVQYTDAQVAVGETVTVELRAEADSLTNGFSVFMVYQGQGLKLVESSDAADSFPPGSLGIQADEDHATFADVLRNRGSWTGAATDTFEYVALTAADSVQGNTRAAVLSFIGVSTGTWTITYVFDTTTNRITAMTAANGNASDLLTSDDSGVIRVIVVDTPSILALAFVSDTPARFDGAPPVDTTPSGDTVWFAAETQVVTLTVGFTSTNPDSILVGAVFDSAAQIDASAPFTAQFFIRPAHAAAETSTTLHAYDASGAFDTTLIRFRPDTAPPDTVTPLSPVGGASAVNPTCRWSPSADSGSGLAFYRLQVSDSSAFATILASDTTAPPDTDLAPAPLGAGTYYWRVLAYDSVGNVSVAGARAESWVVLADTTAPDSFGLLAPGNGAETSATRLTFRWTAAADSSTVTYRLIVDTDLAGAYLVDTTVSDTEEIVTLGANDTYLWRVIASDTGGNTRPAGDSLVVIDTQAPTGLSLGLPADRTETKAATTTFSWNAAVDTGSGLASYRLQIDTAGTFAAPWLDTAVTATSLVIAPAGNDTFSWRVIARDDAGNADTSATRTVLFDTRSPAAVTTTYPSDSQTINDSTPTFTWNAASDSVTGTRGYLIQVASTFGFDVVVESAFVTGTSHTSAALVDSRYFWRVIPYDTVSNADTASARVHDFTVDTSLPTDTTAPDAFDLSEPSDGIDTREVTVTLRWEDSFDAGSPPVRYRVQVDTGGAFTAGAIYLDTNGILDTWATVTLKANEISYWQVVAYDASGNTETATSAPWSIFVDTAGPVAGALTAPADNTDTNGATITFRWNAAADTGTGVAGYRLQFDPTGAFAPPPLDSFTPLTSATLPALLADTVYWRVVAVDNMGNTTAVAARVLRVDTRAPYVGALTAPPANTDTSATALAFSWTASTDTGSGLAGYRLQIDTTGTFAAPWVDSAVGLALAALRTLPANDTYWWRIVAVDSATNTASYTSFRLRIDTSGPSAPALASPADGLETSSVTVLFSWNASTDSSAGVSHYRLQADTAGTFATPVRDSVTPSTSGTLTLPANDTYTWRVVAVDSAGNATAGSSRILRVDTAPPTLPVLVAIRGDSRAAPATLSWTAATDSVTSVRVYVVQVDTAGTFVSLRESTQQAHPDTDYVTGVLPADTYWWRVLAYDTVGNVATSAVDSFLVIVTDTKGPNPFDLVSPSTGTSTSAVSITFRWPNVTDDSSPPVTYRLQVDTAGTFVAPLMDTSWLTETRYVATLPANDTYRWRVIARDNALNTTVCNAAFTLAVDTAGPTAPVLVARSGATTVTPTLLRWGASGDSIAGLASYRVQVSASALFAANLVDSTLAASDTDHWTPPAAPGTWYWRVTTADSLGNTSVSAPASDSFVVVADSSAPTADSPVTTPSSVSNTGTTAIVITVNVTDSAYVDTVVVDLSGVGLTDSYPLTPVGGVPSTDSRWTATVVLDSTVAGGTYDLVVRIVDPSGNTGTTTIRITVVDTTPSMAAIIDSPLYNIRAGGSALSIISTYGDTYGQVLYQYRLVPNGAWVNCTSATGSTNPDTVAPFWGFYWDISTLVSGQSYDVRVRATDRNGVTDPSPSYVRVTIAATDSNVNEYRDGATGFHTRRQQTRNDTVSTLLIADGTGLVVPAGLFADSAWVRVVLRDTVPSSTPLGGVWFTVGDGSITEMTREDGTRNFAGNVTVILPYDDTDALNDYVGRTSTLEADLRIYWFDDVNRVWTPVTSSTVDYVNNVVRAQVNHFTVFAILLPSPAAANLAGVVVFPNPFVPYDGEDRNGKPYNSGDASSGIIFDSLPQQVTVEIFDLAGRLVSTFSKNDAFGRYNWDARGDDGREVSSGVYIAVLKSATTGERVTRKIMIIR